MKTTFTILIAPFVAIAIGLGEDLSSPPLVTAESWAIADGTTGEILFGGEVDTPRKTASITKLMCAYTVMKLAVESPEILEELVTFSELADATVGSTANVREGEGATVFECLYGLLLPSGNDVGNALAEHFADRLDPPDEEMLDRALSNPKLSTRANFLAEMNRNARALGMDRTFYWLPFGDGGTSEDRTSTARDLCRLAIAAMKYPLLQKIVATQKWEGTVIQKDGLNRAETWENTNSLLGLGAGYDGIKTGYTKGAGRCLLATGIHEGRRLIVVVLGSDSKTARDADARNLFRWAWANRIASRN